jgi:hypothetical protein
MGVGPVNATGRALPLLDRSPLSGADRRWLVRRLVAMGPWEMLVRLRRVLRDGTARMARGRRVVIGAEPWPLVDTPARTDAAPALTDGERAALVAAADRLVAGEDVVMGWSWRRVGRPPAWRRDPLTGLTLPGGFGPALDYRDAARFGEVRRVWELSRHHRWVVLAWAWESTGHDAYARTIASELQDWCRSSPYPEGPGWASALEVAVRIVSWSSVVRAAGGALPPEAHRAFAHGAELSLRFLLAHRSIGSSANNHAVGEAVGMVVGADGWPTLPSASRARATGWRVLARETSRQIGEDGWPLEQSVAYGLFVLDLLLEVLRSPSAAARRESRVVRDRARALAECLAFLEAIGEPPGIGDGDDGQALPAPDPLARWDAVLGAALPTLLGSVRPPRTTWGGLSCRRRLAVQGGEGERAARRRGSRAFPQGGMVALAAGAMTALVDVGPLGYGALAAHGHADCLQVLLWVAGRAILVDAGMPTYFEEPALRDRYRATAAHNTVAVGRTNQSEILGPFLWGRRARVVARRWDLEAGTPWVEAAHDGYRRGWRAIHRRRVTLSAEALVVDDRIESESLVPWIACWQFHPACRVEATDGGWCVERPPVRLVVRPSAPARVEWGEVSPSFGLREPAPRLVVSGRRREWRTIFALEGGLA